MISLCTANYNKWKYIINFLDSLKKYESEYISEVVIVDDCSTDNSCALILERANNNKNFIVKLLSNSSNLWPWPSYNNSINNASWDYIMILDSDDFLISSSLKQKLQYFSSQPNCKIVYWNGKMYNQKKRKFTTDSLNDTFFNTVFSNKLQNIKEYFITNVSNLYVPWALIKKSFLKEIWWFDSEVKSNDWVLNIKIFNFIKNKEEVWYYNIPCFWYRIWEENITNNYTKMEEIMIEVANKYATKKRKKKLMANIYYTISMNAMKVWNKKIAYKYFNKSLNFELNFKKTLWFWIAYLLPCAILNSDILKKNTQKIYIYLTK